MIEFPFKKWHSEKFGKILKPFIPVKIIGPKRSVDIFMLLDSGADISLIPYSVGKTIGMELDLSHPNEAHGIYDTALIIADSGLHISEKLKFKKGIAASYNNIGAVYYAQGKLK